MSTEGGGFRRGFLRNTAVIGAGLLFREVGLAARVRAEPGPTPAAQAHPEGEPEVTAVEDLMREHGVLRRALLVYTETAAALRRAPVAVSPVPLQQTAKLFRAFGEDYHEKKLEEAFVFPAIKQAGGPAAVYADILIAQHQRGREITDYILAVTQAPRFEPATAEALAQTMDAFVLMYRSHAAREDTIVFPAWKRTLSAHQLDELGERFEAIEHQQFGADGYEEAVRQIGAIETRLGLADLSRFTAPPPPKH